SPVPIISSLAWLQRGCGTCGFTFAQKPYSAGCSASHMPFGRLSVKLKRTIDLIDLKPYFHGSASRSGAPCCRASGWPLSSGGEEGKLVSCFRHCDALDIRPRIPRLPLAWGDLRVPEGFHALIW